MNKDTIGINAIKLLRELGEAIEEGCPETIGGLWVGQGQRLVDAAILNNIIKAKIDNPFCLYYMDDDYSEHTEKQTETAIYVTKAVKDILDKLATDIIALEVTCEYCDEVPAAVESIRDFYNSGVGLSDTTSREAMAEYLENALSKVFDEDDYKKMGRDLWILL